MTMAISRDELIQQGVEAYESKNNYFKVMSRISSEIIDQQGEKGLQEYVDDLNEAIGKHDASYLTLKQYAWYYNRTKDLDLPEDLTVTAIVQIASIKGDVKRRQFARLIKKNGWSSKDILYKLKYK